MGYIFSLAVVYIPCMRSIMYMPMLELSLSTMHKLIVLIFTFPRVYLLRRCSHIANNPLIPFWMELIW